MTHQLLAKDIRESKIPDLRKKCQNLQNKGLTPFLKVIIVGDNPASVLYVRNKEKLCKEIGINFELIKLKEDVSEEDFLSEVNKINNDDLVTGCFVQLPVPKHLSNIDITQLINPIKDVDGFHFESIRAIYNGDTNGYIPCTPKGIVTLLESKDIKLEGQNVTIIGRSHIVGKPLSVLLTSLNATVTLCHSRTKDIREHTKRADIIVSAVGNPIYLDRSYLNDSKEQVIIDVGICKHEGKTVGDVNFEDVKEHVAAITPVPGGVGPMTVFSLMENILKATENILERK